MAHRLLPGRTTAGLTVRLSPGSQEEAEAAARAEATAFSQAAAAAAAAAEDEGAGGSSEASAARPARGNGSGGGRGWAAVRSAKEKGGLQCLEDPLQVSARLAHRPAQRRRALLPLG